MTMVASCRFWSRTAGHKEWINVQMACLWNVLNDFADNLEQSMWECEGMWLMVQKWNYIWLSENDHAVNLIIGLDQAGYVAATLAHLQNIN